MIRAQISKLCTICSEKYLSFFRLEKAGAKLPKKDLAAVKKRFAFLEVSFGVVLRVICSCCDECCVNKQASLVDHNQASFGLFLPCFIISMNLHYQNTKPSQAKPILFQLAPALSLQATACGHQACRLNRLDGLYAC